MTRATRYLSSLFLSVALLAPAALIAAPAAQEDRGVYDREHKDYHHWDDHENEVWKRFLVENHRKEHDFARANKREQAEYWNWRHSHPD